jgi:glycosyltransferase involved in cell wall biosynthesis
MLKREHDGWVLHVAALGNLEALEAFRRTTRVVATLGVGQVLLALDERTGADAGWFEAIAGEVRRLHCSGLSIIRKIRTLQSEFRKLFHERAVYAVHLHGVRPGLLALRALKGTALQGRLLYSPDRGQFGSAWCTALLGCALRMHLSPFHYAALAASLVEAQALSKLLNRSAEVLPPPVSDLFFAAPRQEGTRPSIFAHGSSVEAVDRLTRLCVLLNSREARVSFSWQGTAEGKAKAQLEAANVHVLDGTDDACTGEWLSRASIFVDLSLRDQVPLFLAQAMAAGLPCLASDIPSHRALIDHGENGLICTSEWDFLEKTILLLRDRAERRRLGEAARADATRRFTLRHFEGAILRAYGFFGSNALPPARLNVLPSSHSHEHAAAA